MRGRVIAVAAGLLLAGCSGASVPASAPTPASSVMQTPPPPTSAAAPAAPRPLAVGQTLAVYLGTDLEANVTLRAVEVDPACEYRYDYEAQDQAKGRAHHVALQLEVDATPKAQGFVNVPSFAISEQLDGGLTATSTALSSGTEADRCLAGRPILDTVDAGTKQSGWLLLGVQNPTGSVLWKNSTVGVGVTIAYPQPGSPTTAPMTDEAPTVTSTESPTTMDDVPTTTDEEPTTTAPVLQCGPGGGCVTVTAPENSPLPPQGPEPCSGYSGCSGVDTGPGCGQRSIAAGSFNPNCAEYQGYLDPGVAGDRAPSSSDLQTQYGCQQGYITGPQCDPYR